MRVCIYGGSFNPPTKCHINIIKQLSTMFDEVLVEPAVNHLFKGHILDFDHRYNMLVDAIADIPKVKVMKDEIDNADGSTYKLYTHIKNTRYKSTDEFYVCIGGDVARNLHNWRYHDKLKQKVKFVVFSREEEGDEKHWYRQDPNVIYIELPPKETEGISSSKFRETLDPNILPTQVIDYIKKNNLYCYGGLENYLNEIKSHNDKIGVAMGDVKTLIQSKLIHTIACIVVEYELGKALNTQSHNFNEYGKCDKFFKVVEIGDVIIENTKRALNGTYNREQYINDILRVVHNIKNTFNESVKDVEYHVDLMQIPAATFCKIYYKINTKG